MKSRVERTIVPGSLVREPAEELRKVVASEAKSGEVIVSLLETATDEVLDNGPARLWVVLTDRRALVVAANEQGDSHAETADATTVSRKGKLGRDELTIGGRKLKCPLLRGGSEFKQFAALAEAHPIERLRIAARTRFDEEQWDATVALAGAGLDQGPDAMLLTLRVTAIVAAEKYSDLGNAMLALVKNDPNLSLWKELEESIGEDSRALQVLYQSAVEAGVGSKIRARLTFLRAGRPRDQLSAELAISMDADEGSLDEGLERIMGWRTSGSVTAETYLNATAVLFKAGLDCEPLHRTRAMTLAETGNLGDAVEAIERALGLDKTTESLRVQADLLLRARRAIEAIAPLEGLVELGEDDYWIRSKLGEAYEAHDDIGQAISSRERAIDRLDESSISPERAAAERRALARLHRQFATEVSTEERELRLAYADLLERGLDWAARLIDPPDIVFAGTTLETTVEILAARRLTKGATTASLSYLEEIIAPKTDRPSPPPAPALLAGGIAGTWPPEEDDSEEIKTGKKSARVRYSIGEETWAGLGDGQPRGLHRATLRIAIPGDVRPSYTSERVKGQLDLEISPPGARFALVVGTCHELSAVNTERVEEREGKGRLPLRARISDADWALGHAGRVDIESRLGLEKVPTKIELSLIATERMRPPHKGERVVETLTWTAPIFSYEHDLAELDRSISIELPTSGTTTGFWTWFEVVWNLRVRLLRKEKPEATVEVPVLVRYPAIEPEISAIETSPPHMTKGVTQTESPDCAPSTDAEDSTDDTMKTQLMREHDPRATLPGGILMPPPDDAEETARRAV